MSASYLAKLDTIMRKLSLKLGVSAEVVVIAGHELLWHSKTEHPDPNLIIRANVGFRRSLYEFDVLSQLYLSSLDWEEVQAKFYIDGFYDTVRSTSQETRWMDVKSVKNRLQKTRGQIFASDLEGNHMGIRRFATLVDDPDGKFLHLLTVAEPATKVSDEAALVNRYRDALLKARKELVELVLVESAARRPMPKHHVLPQRGG